MNLRLACRLRLLLLVFGVALPLAAISHPDLLIQIDGLNKQIEVHPADLELRLKRGDLYRRHENYEAAARDFEMVRMLDSGYLLLDYYQGRLLFQNGDAAGCEQLLSRYLTTYPEHAAAWVLRGRANMLLQQSSQAAGFFSSALKASARPSPELHRLQILAVAAGGEENATLALQAVESGLANFVHETSLLGLGTDISLAWNRPADAQRFIDDLPNPLLKLPQWKMRVEIADCLITPALHAQTTCLSRAREQLAHQVANIGGQLSRAVQ